LAYEDKTKGTVLAKTQSLQYKKLKRLVIHKSACAQGRTLVIVHDVADLIILYNTQDLKY